MTTDDIRTRAAQAAATAPQAEKLPPRTELDAQADDAWHRMQAATDPAIKRIWERRMNNAKFDRGDFDAAEQVKREHLDRPGERHDD